MRGKWRKEEGGGKAEEEGRNCRDRKGKCRGKERIIRREGDNPNQLSFQF